VRDADGNVGTDTVTVTVRDVTPPAVTISSPSDGASVPGATVIVASATDNLAVVRVEFLVDGVAVGNDTSAPFEWSIAAGSLKDGNHTLTVIAFDAAGNSASAAVHVTVTNVAGGRGLGLFEVAGFLGILAVIGGIVVALLLIARRKPRRPTMAPLVAVPMVAPTSVATTPEVPPAPEPAPEPPTEELPDIDNL